jgi:hypothetical protein
MGREIVKFRTRAAAVAVALPMILGLAACGDTDKAGGGATQPAPTQTSTSAPVTSSTPEVSTPEVSTPPPAAEPVHLTNASFLPALKAGTGKAKSWKAKTVMTVAGQPITMTSSQTTNPLAMKMEMLDPADDKPVTMILVKSVIYVSIPGQTPAGKFAKVDLKNSKDPQVAQFRKMLESADPMSSYKGWDKSLRGVRFVKSETIGGQKLDRYDITVDTAAALQVTGQPIPKGVPKTLVYSVWMGADKLIYRMTFSMSGVDMVMTMSDYNQPISITAPPANKIIAKR